MSAQTADAEITIIKYGVQITAMLLAIENNISFHMMVSNDLPEFFLTFFREEIAYDMKPQWVADSLKGGGSFMRNLFDVATNMQSHDFECEKGRIPGLDIKNYDLLSLFTAEECYDQWRIRNIDWYLGYGAAPQTNSLMPFSQKNLLKNIIATADTVTQTQATLRFGHEVCVMPLACLLELGNSGAVVEDLGKLDEVWRNYNIFPMGCNIQLIFYRPKKGKSGDILVKALLNEREQTLPVPTDSYPYYKWSDLRKYYVDKIERFEAIDKEQ